MSALVTIVALAVESAATASIALVVAAVSTTPAASTEVVATKSASPSSSAPSTAIPSTDACCLGAIRTRQLTAAEAILKDRSLHVFKREAGQVTIEKTKLLALLPELWSLLIINLNRDLPCLSLEDVKRAILQEDFRRRELASADGAEAASISRGYGSGRGRGRGGDRFGSNNFIVAEDEGEAEAAGVADMAATTRDTDAVAADSTASATIVTRADICGTIASRSLMDGILLKAKRNGDNESKSRENRFPGQLFFVSTQAPAAPENDESFEEPAAVEKMIMHSLDYWVTNSGATYSMTPRAELLTELEPSPVKHVISALGKAMFKGADGKTVGLKNVLWVPNLAANLISIPVVPMPKERQMAASISTKGEAVGSGDGANGGAKEIKSKKCNLGGTSKLGEHKESGAGAQKQDKGEENPKAAAGEDYEESMWGTIASAAFSNPTSATGECDWLTLHRRTGHVASAHGASASTLAQFGCRALTHVGADKWVLYEEWIGRKPKVDMLRVFGCMCMALVPKHLRHNKLGAKAIWAVHLGMAQNSMGWLLWDSFTKKFLVSRDCKFMENLMYKDWKVENEAKIGVRFGEVKSSGFEHVKLPLELSSGTTTTRQSSLVNGGEEAKDAEEEEEEVQQPANSALAGVAMMVGDDEETEYEEFAFAFYSLVEMPREPTTLKEALESSDAEDWKKALESQLKSIEENGTLELVELPEGRKAIMSKWLFKIKSDADGKIERYKSRLVAKGYQQKEKLREILEEIGFTPSSADHSLFMLGEGEQRSFMVVYVDDILIFSPSSDLVKEVMLKFQDKFKCKALGDVSFYLWLHIERDVEKRCMQVHQRKYLEALSANFGQSEGHVATPFPSGLKSVKGPEEESVVERVVSAAMRKERAEQASQSSSQHVAPAPVAPPSAALPVITTPPPQANAPPPHAIAALAAAPGACLRLLWVPPLAYMEYVSTAGGAVTVHYPSLLPVNPAPPAAGVAQPLQALVGPLCMAEVPKATVGQPWRLFEGLRTVHLIQVYGHAALSRGNSLDGGPRDECLDAADRLAELLAPVLTAPARGGVAGVGQLGTTVRGLLWFSCAGTAVDVIGASTVVVHEVHRSLRRLLDVFDQASAGDMVVEGAEDEEEDGLEAATTMEAAEVAAMAMTTRTTDAVADGSTASVIFATRADTCGTIATSSLMDGLLIKAKRVEQGGVTATRVSQGAIAFWVNSSSCPRKHRLVQRRMKALRSQQLGVIDSGATYSMTLYVDLLTELEPSPVKHVTSALGQRAEVKGMGKAFFKGADGKMVGLKNVLWVPNLAANLISVRRLQKVGMDTSSKGTKTYTARLGERILWDLHEDRDVFKEMWQILVVPMPKERQVAASVSTKGEAIGRSDGANGRAKENESKKCNLGGTSKLGDHTKSGAAAKEQQNGEENPEAAAEEDYGESMWALLRVRHSPIR
ncbi:unnamed protein product [Closterium sp. NIES-54]